MLAGPSNWTIILAPFQSWNLFLSLHVNSNMVTLYMVIIACTHGLRHCLIPFPQGSELQSLCTSICPIHPILLSYNHLFLAPFVLLRHAAVHIPLLWNKLLGGQVLSYLSVLPCLKLQECLYTCTFYFMTKITLKISIFCKDIFPISLTLSLWKEWLEVRQKNSTCWGKWSN